MWSHERKSVLLLFFFIIMFELIFLNKTVYQFEDLMFILCTIGRFDHSKFKSSIPAFSKPNNNVSCTVLRKIYTLNLFCSPNSIKAMNLKCKVCVAAFDTDLNRCKDEI